MLGEMVEDDGLQFGHAPDYAPARALAGGFGEEALGQVQPRRRRRDEIQLEARVFCEPSPDLFGVVGQPSAFFPFAGFLALRTWFVSASSI
jgi:hypothetical protein